MTGDDEEVARALSRAAQSDRARSLSPGVATVVIQELLQRRCADPVVGCATLGDVRVRSRSATFDQRTHSGLKHGDRRVGDVVTSDPCNPAIAGRTPNRPIWDAMKGRKSRYGLDRS